MRSVTPLLSVLLLALVLACDEKPTPPKPPRPPAADGGTPNPPPPPPPAAATGLAYVNPTGTGWRLVEDASSTSTRLVLNLVGPSGLLSRGAGFNLKAPAAVRFARFDGSDFPLKEGGVYELKNVAPVGEPDPLEPVLLAGAVKAGNLLTVGAFQKDRRASAKDSGASLFQIALELDAAAGLRVGEALPLRITKAGHIAEDIGVLREDAQPTYDMLEKARLVPMQIELGTLRAH